MQRRWPWLAALMLMLAPAMWCALSGPPPGEPIVMPSDEEVPDTLETARRVFYDRASARIHTTAETCGLPVSIVCADDVCAYALPVVSPYTALTNPRFVLARIEELAFDQSACDQASWALYAMPRVYETYATKVDSRTNCGVVARTSGRYRAQHGEFEAYQDMAEVACAAAAQNLHR